MANRQTRLISLQKKSAHIERKSTRCKSKLDHGIRKRTKAYKVKLTMAQENQISGKENQVTTK